MKRTLVVATAVLATLGLTAGASAQTTDRSSSPLRQFGRFHQVAVPSHAKITNLPSHADPNKVVTATVVLQGDDVSTAEANAQAAGQTFDRKGAQRRVADEQAAATPKLRAAGATVRSATQTALNSVVVNVKVKDLSAVASIAGVTQVHVSRTVHRLNGTSDLYTGVPSAWNDLGLTGKGEVIGVIDDGIDYYHADFGGNGNPASYANDNHAVIEPGTFPTAKVIGGYDFVGDAYNADNGTTPVPDADPIACGEHGTHVSGTAAGEGVLSNGSTYTGPYNSATLSSHTFNVAPGAAPEAKIRIYKVFGCEGSVNDDVIVAAIDRATADGVNVINMSLGSPWGSNDEPEALAIDHATKLGVLSVVAAGNEGQNAYMVGGPSTANTALSVAAIDVSYATLPGVAITGDVTLNAQNSNLHDWTGGTVTGSTVDLGLGCDAADYAGTAGKIVVTHRGICDRVARATLGQAAGVAGVIFVNNAPGLPPVEGAISGVTIPFVGVAGADAGLFTDGQTLTLGAGADMPNPAYTKTASFSSAGPRGDSVVKPDIAAPGVSLLSAGVGTGTGGIVLSGTSMATPHTAGIALLVRQAHPTWGPLAIKAALMSNADPSRIGDYNVLNDGAGLVSPKAAADTVAYFSTRDGLDNLAFGFQELKSNYTATRTIDITNTSRSAITYDLSAQLDSLGLSKFSVSINPKSVKVQGRSSVTIAVTLKINDPQHLPDASTDDAGGLSSINGLVWATPRGSATGVHALKAPLLLVPYGTSDVQAAGAHTGARTRGPQVVDTLLFSNRGVHAGNYDTYAWLLTDRSRDNGDSRVPDVRDVGVQQFNLAPGADLAVFAISTNNRFATQATNEYDLLIDVNHDGNPDFVLVGIDNGLLTAGEADGNVVAFLIDLSDNSIVDGFNTSAPANGSTIELPMLIQDLGGPTSFDVTLAAYTVLDSLAPDVTGTAHYDAAHLAVQSGDFGSLAPGHGAGVPVTVDPAAAAAQGTLGWLIVSQDDAAAKEADRVPLYAARGDR